MGKILFVDDDQTMRNAMKITLKEHDLKIAEDKDNALKMLEQEEFDLLLTDLYMPEKELGLSLVKEAKNLDENLYIVVVTGFATIESAVEAVKLGADDYITKEFSPDGLRLSVKKFLKARINKLKLKTLQAENQLLREQSFSKVSLIGESAAMAEIKKKIQLAAKDNESTVLILGKSGTGKELVAKEIHDGSPRRSQSFIPIDCPTLPKDLFETELFGYERGAFTDAKVQKLGRIELAHRGSLFLDEIGDLPLPMQSKLLRFLETSEFFRIGGTRPIKVKVRIIASTNQNLAQLVEVGLFREDLYYRLQVVVIQMPDLKERGDDVKLLAQHFLKEINTRKRTSKELSSEQLKHLTLHDWPGNVRELRNVMESFAVMEEFPFSLKGAQAPEKNYKEAKQEAISSFERSYLKKALEKNHNNVTQTAKEVGLSREELSRKIKKLNL
jgi:DNA-binding NtrC family response regulator